MIAGKETTSASRKSRSKVGVGARIKSTKKASRVAEPNGKKRASTEKSLIAELPVTIEQTPPFAATPCVHEEPPASTQTPVDDFAPTCQVPPFVNESFSLGSVIETSQSITTCETALEPVCAPLVEIADEQHTSQALLSSSAESHQIAKPERKFWNHLFPLVTAIWSKLHKGLKSHQSKKRLRVCESVSLGEKRFVAVIQVDGEQFLVGGSSSSISTLAHLERPRDFSEVFGQRYQQDLSQA